MKRRPSKSNKGRRRTSFVFPAVGILLIVLGLRIAADAQAAQIGTFLLLPALAFLGFAIWHRYMRPQAPNRPGLLNDEIRPPFTLVEQQNAAILIGTLALSRLQRPDGPEMEPKSVSDIMSDEVKRLALKWTDNANSPLSDDEIRSILLLYRSVDENAENLVPLSAEDEAMLEDRETVREIHQKISQFLEKRKKSQTDHETWLANVGDPDASHLIADGWIPFLEGFQKPDIQLWHSIATDFHGLYGDRLNAAFWIARQPACDCATVWGFISGVIGYDILEDALERSSNGDSVAGDQVALFSTIVGQWNSGFYKFHSLEYESDFLPNDYIFDGHQLNETLSDLEAKFGIPLPRLSKMIVEEVSAKDDLSRSSFSPFSFWDDKGLHLQYPHDWPEQSG